MLPMPMLNPAFITLAHALADASAELLARYFSTTLNVETKADASPVSIADREAEKIMRELIAATFPEHSIYGEEYGVELAGSSQLQRPPSPTLPRKGGGSSEASSPARGERVSPSYTWILDPIDGTRAFLAGKKEWGTLIALCENGVPILGVLNQPITGERWVGVRGQPTLYNGAPCRTRTTSSLAAAEISTTSAAFFTPEQTAQCVALAKACKHTVTDGDCYAYGLLARGLRDIVIDVGLKPYDILALVPIVQGAGGCIRHFNGEEMTLENYANVIATGCETLQKNVRAYFT